MRVLGLIPARGGSKGVPRKNIRSLCGRPLLAYTAEAALRAATLGRVVLTTEDEEIADVGRACGLDVPFLRPRALAADETPMIPVVQHAIAELEAAGDRFDAVCLLQPTAPLRRAEDIDACVERLVDQAAETVISVLPVPEKFNPYWVYLGDPDHGLRLGTGEDRPIPRRQDLPAAYHRDGAVYVVRRDVVMEQGSLYGTPVCGYVSDPARAVNIDHMSDWALAEQLLSNAGQPSPDLHE